MLDWIKKTLIEKWLGRAITIALAAVGGWLTSKGIDAGAVNGWINSTQDLISAALPVVIAIVLQWVQHRTALNTTPPAK